MGRRRILERSVCSCCDREAGLAWFDCNLYGRANRGDGALPVFALARISRVVVWPDGLRARIERRGHEYQSDGAGATAFHGACPEHVLFFWNASASDTRHNGWVDCISRQPGSWLWPDRRRLCASLRQRLLADEGATDRRVRRRLTRLQQLAAKTDWVETRLAASPISRAVLPLPAETRQAASLPVLLFFSLKF